MSFLHVVSPQELFVLPEPEKEHIAHGWVTSSSSPARSSSNGPRADGIASSVLSSNEQSASSQREKQQEMRRIQRIAVARDQEAGLDAEWYARVEKYCAVVKLHQMSLVSVVMSQEEAVSGSLPSALLTLACPVDVKFPLPVLLRKVATDLSDDELARTMLAALRQIACGIRHLHACGVAYGGLSAAAVVSNARMTEFALMPPTNFSAGTMSEDVRDLGRMMAEMLASARRSEIAAALAAPAKDMDEMNNLLVAEGHGLPLLHLMSCQPSALLGYALKNDGSRQKSMAALEKLIPKELITEFHAKAFANLPPSDIPDASPHRSVKIAIRVGCRDSLLFAFAPKPAGLGYTTSTVLSDHALACAIHCAAHVGNCTSIEHLVEHGADVNMPSKRGGPVAVAAISGNVAALKLLVKLGADIRQPGQRKRPIREAAAFATPEIMAAFVELGEAVDQADEDDCTPLYSACQHGNLQVVKYLVEHGADVNQYARIFTPLLAKATMRRRGICSRSVRMGPPHLHSQLPARRTRWFAIYLTEGSTECPPCSA